MSFHFHNSHFLFHKILTSKLSGLYILQACFTFVKSLIGIFIPIYFYSIGISIPKIILFYIVISVFFILSIKLVIKCINLFGLKTNFFISSFLFISHILLINFVEQSEIYFYLSAISAALLLSFFWLSFHLEFSLNEDKKKISSELGTLSSIILFVSALSPILGGFILESFSYIYILALSTIILLIGSIVLLLSKSIETKKVSFDYKYLFNIKKNFKDKVSFFSSGILFIFMIIFFPIYLYEFLDNNFFSLGIVVSIVSILIAIIILFVKKYFDKFPRNKTLKFLSYGISTSWFLRIFLLVLSYPALLIYEFFHNFLNHLLNISYMGIFYNNSKKEGLNYILVREFYIHIGRILILLICLFVFYLGVELKYILFLGVIFFPLMSLLKER